MHALEQEDLLSCMCTFVCCQACQSCAHGAASLVHGPGSVRALVQEQHFAGGTHAGMLAYLCTSVLEHTLLFYLSDPLP